MNSALDKVGVYDFFGVLLSGMIVIVVSCCLDLPLINLIANVENDIVNAILFLVGSFFLGLVLQEISSVLDKKVFKFRENARCKFLNDENKIIGNELELKSFRELANKILNKSNDGFFIASEDLKLRGPGDFFGIRQSGDLVFALADIYQDAAVLQEASEEVKTILEEDPELTEPGHHILQKKMMQFQEEQLSKMNL